MLSERLATTDGSMPSGMGRSIASANGTFTASLAKPPYDWGPMGSPYVESLGTDSQLPGSPARQRAHSPQETWKGMLTRSPGSTESTESPTSVTSPTHSCPKEKGPTVGNLPWT